MAARTAPKDRWDKADVIGKIILAPVLVGVVGLLVSQWQNSATRADREFSLALSVLEKPVQNDEGAIRARQWAREILESRLGGKVPVEDVARAVGNPFVLALSSKDAFVAIMSGEVAREDLLRDPRFSRCPGDSRLAACVVAVLRFIETPEFEQP